MQGEMNEPSPAVMASGAAISSAPDWTISAKYPPILMSFLYSTGEGTLPAHRGCTGNGKNRVAGR